MSPYTAAVESCTMAAGLHDSQAVGVYLLLWLYNDPDSHREPHPGGIHLRRAAGGRLKDAHTGHALQQDCAGGHRQPCGVGVPEAQQSPGSHMVVATLMIVGLALLIDAAYAYGLIPGAVVHARPILLYANGQMLSENLRHCLLTPEKLRSELRSKGHDSLPQIFAIVLEPTGTFAVITDDAASKTDLSLLEDVEGYEHHLKHLGQTGNSAAAAPAGPTRV